MAEGEGQQPWEMSIPSGEGGQPWDMHIETGAEMQAREAAERWAMHEMHEANVRAIAQRHSAIPRRAQNRQRARRGGRVCSNGQRHAYHSIFSLRGTGDSAGHSHQLGVESKGFWATMREWFPVFFGG